VVDEAWSAGDGLALHLAALITSVDPQNQQVQDKAMDRPAAPAGGRCSPGPDDGDDPTFTVAAMTWAGDVGVDGVGDWGVLGTGVAPSAAGARVGGATDPASTRFVSPTTTTAAPSRGRAAAGGPQAVRSTDAITRPALRAFLSAPPSSQDVQEPKDGSDVALRRTR